MLLDMLINDFLPLLVNAAIQVTVALIAAFPQLAMQIVQAIPKVFVIIWNAISAELKKLKDNVIKPALDSIKAKFTEAWESVKKSFSLKIAQIKESIYQWRMNVADQFDMFKNSAKAKFEQVKTAITKPIEEAKTKVKGVVDAIKNFFSNMKLSLTKIKLPHFKVTGKLSIDPPSVPKLSIEWYKKAMGSPILMNEPTIFGYNPSNGSFMGGGEAGSEVVSGTNTLMNMIQNAVSSENGAIVYYLQKIIAVLADYFPQLLDALDFETFDEGLFIKRNAAKIDRELGKIQAGKVRGR